MVKHKKNPIKLQIKSGYMIPKENDNRGILNHFGILMLYNRSSQIEHFIT